MKKLRLREMIDLLFFFLMYWGFFLSQWSLILLKICSYPLPSTPPHSPPQSHFHVAHPGLSSSRLGIILRFLKCPPIVIVQQQVKSLSLQSFQKRVNCTGSCSSSSSYSSRRNLQESTSQICETIRDAQWRVYKIQFLEKNPGISKKSLFYSK